MKRQFAVLAIAALLVIAPSASFALEKNHSHRWSNNEHHKRFKPLDMSAEDAQKAYNKSMADLEKSIDANDTGDTRANAAKALSALETMMRSSDDKGYVEAQRDKERMLDSIRHSAGRRDMRKAKQQFDTIKPTEKPE